MWLRSFLCGLFGRSPARRGLCESGHFRDGPSPASESQGMAHLTGEFPRVIPRAVWLTARARNAVHRPMFIGAVGIGTFVAVLVAHAVRAAADQALQRAAAGRSRCATGHDAVHRGAWRTRGSDSPPPTRRSPWPAFASPQYRRSHVDTINPELIARRDSLSTAINDLDACSPASRPRRSRRRIARSRSRRSCRRIRGSRRSSIRSPTSIAIATRSARPARRSGLRRADDARDGDRARDSGTRTGAARRAAPADRQGQRTDAAHRRSRKRRPSTPPAWIAERDSAQSLVTQATTALTDARGKSEEYDRAVTRAREEASSMHRRSRCSPRRSCFGIALGFGSAFVDEMRHPRVSDEHEVERVTGARVLATTVARDRDSPTGSRRAADKRAPATSIRRRRLPADVSARRAGGCEPADADDRRRGYRHRRGRRDERRGDRGRRSAQHDHHRHRLAHVAGRRGAAHSRRARRRRHSRSIASIGRKSRRRRRSAAIATSTSCRVASSNDKLDTAQVTELFRHEAARLARHYEAVIIVTPLEQATAGLPGVLPIPDTILCARVGHTRIAQRAISRSTEFAQPAAIRSASSCGMRRRRRFRRPSESRRAASVRTAEMRAMTGAATTLRSGSEHLPGSHFLASPCSASIRRVWADTLLSAEQQHLLRLLVLGRAFDHRGDAASSRCSPCAASDRRCSPSSRCRWLVWGVVIGAIAGVEWHGLHLRDVSARRVSSDCSG